VCVLSLSLFFVSVALGFFSFLCEKLVGQKKKNNKKKKMASSPGGTTTILAHAALSRLFPSPASLRAHPLACAAFAEHTAACARCLDGRGALAQRGCFLDSGRAQALAAALLAPLPLESAEAWPADPLQLDAALAARCVPSLEFVLAHPLILAAFVKHAGEDSVPCIALLADLAPLVEAGQLRVRI
jgi:hypothetical protein